MSELHRDDMPDDLLEHMGKLFPGMKIVCAGDIPTDKRNPEIEKVIKEQQKLMDKSLFFGTCFDCGKQMPNFPQSTVISEDWNPAQGWSLFNGLGDQPSFWVCPECDDEDDDPTAPPQP